jgi:hypothetical protein
VHRELPRKGLKNQRHINIAGSELLHHHGKLLPRRPKAPIFDSTSRIGPLLHSTLNPPVRPDVTSVTSIGNIPETEACVPVTDFGHIST